MCGIVGVFAFTEIGKKCIPHISLALPRLFNRGPDAQNILQDENFALGHTRLSIIDTSTAANQPYVDPSGRYMLVFNGEIFNYQQLKQQKLKSTIFETSSDTEVLLHLLIRYGVSCLSDLHGFFAFCFYDNLEQKVILVRDRFGKKPLLYYHDAHSFVFASEIKALEAFKLKLTLNKTTVYEYFRFSYNPSNSETIYEEVNKLPPGYLQIIDLKSKTCDLSQWYEIPRGTQELSSELSYKEAQTELINTLDQAVQDRMLSDVPLGAFLSGGIDSSVVVALASRHTQQLKTFSIGFEDAPFLDETKYAQLVANHFKTEHHLFTINNQVLFDSLFPVLDALDEPFADSSALAVYVLSQKTTSHVTVALSGDGADEIFAGYNKYWGHLKLQKPSFLTSQMIHLESIIRFFPKSRTGIFSNKVRQLQKLIDGLRLEPHDRFLKYCAVNSHEGCMKLFHTNFSQSILSKDIQTVESQLAHRESNIQNVNDILWRDQQMVLPNDMLVKVDLMSMANSLEVRSPFLDHSVVAFANRLPESYKIDVKMKKRIVQDAFKTILPEALYDRPKKGFDVPLIPWFRNELNEYIFEELLSKSFIEQQQIFDYQYVLKLKAKLFSKDIGDVQAQLWALIVFQHWYQKRFSSQ